MVRTVSRIEKERHREPAPSRTEQTKRSVSMGCIFSKGDGVGCGHRGIKAALSKIDRRLGRALRLQRPLPLLAVLNACEFGFVVVMLFQRKAFTSGSVGPVPSDAGRPTEPCRDVGTRLTGHRMPSTPAMRYCLWHRRETAVRLRSTPRPLPFAVARRAAQPESR